MQILHIPIAAGLGQVKTHCFHIRTQQAFTSTAIHQIPAKQLPEESEHLQD